MLSKERSCEVERCLFAYNCNEDCFLDTNTKHSIQKN